ncbi:vitrin isoform X2 [Protopterus annectens]|uniref:vitrin isoform X2 n=1 Tax=Protopterus annectens TaxID=7888 RepID=UPI001CFAB788|nr:vitrin isoform X2 [Protopterus annectens]
MNALSYAALWFVCLLNIVSGSKAALPKNKKSKQHFPEIGCDIRAGKISIPEFIVRCPRGCQDTKQPVYGTDIYASVSSVCNAAIHSGIIGNNGGKILVQKLAGQAGYKGSFSNGVRSLSLPRWRESFIIAEAKPKKGVTYPSVIEFLPSRTSSVRTGSKAAEDTKTPKESENLSHASDKPSEQGTGMLSRKEYKATPAPATEHPSTEAAEITTTVPEPTTVSTAMTMTMTTTTQKLATTQLPLITSSSTISTTTTTTAKPRPPVHKARDAGQIQAVQAKGQSQALRDTSAYSSGINRQLARGSAGLTRQESAVAVQKSASGSPVNSGATRRDWPFAKQRTDIQTGQRKPIDTSVAEPDVGYTWTEVDNYDTTVQHARPGQSEFDKWILGFDQTSNRYAEPDPNWRSKQDGTDARGFNTREQELHQKLPEPVSHGDPNCKIDLTFLIDGSWSIGKRRFRIQKQFLAEVAQVLDVGVAGPLMGIIQYGDDPSTEFNLRTHTNSRDLKLAIDKISQKGGMSNVGKALFYANKNFFSDANGNRGSAPNVAIALVDGWPTDKVEEASRLARESGINIFFVTIEGADEKEKHNVVEPNFVEKAVCRTNGFFSINVPSWFSLHKIVQPLVKRTCDIDRLVCSKTCLNSADIGFIIDGSSSVGTGNFRNVLQFVANITKEFEISDTDTRVGAVQYTYEQRLEFSFDKHSTKQELLNAIKRINYWSGGTSTGAAITYAYEQLFSKSKPNKRKIMIVITDGRSYDDVRIPASTVHRNGVIAYSIGIAWAVQDELEAIATDPDKEHAFFVDEFDNLYKYVSKIIQNICTEFNSQPRN